MTSKQKNTRSKEIWREVQAILRAGKWPINHM
jgi:hypothetical protein